MVDQILMMLAQTSGRGGGNAFLSLLPFLLIIFILYLLILRPQAKRQRQHREMIESLKKGDRIVTAGGIYGTIVGVKARENTLIVKIADNVKIEISRNSVSRKLSSD